MNLASAISGMQYPHWLMIGGTALVAGGSIGFAFQKNTDEQQPRGPNS
jgi:hypothetical protein